MFQQREHVQLNATLDQPGKPNGKDDGDPSSSSIHPPKTRETMMDPHWYQDEEMMDLLLHYVGNHPKIVCLLPQSILYWGDNYHLLREKLLQHTRDYRLHAQSGKPVNNRVLVPIRLTDPNWVLMYIVYANAIDGETKIYYFSPTGEKPSHDLTTMISSDDVLPNAGWCQLEKRVNQDDYNSGVWVVEVARSIAENNTIPSQQHDIHGARKEHARVRMQMTRSKKTWLSNEVLPEGLYTELPQHGSSLDPAVIEGLELVIGYYHDYFKQSRDIPQHRNLDLINLQSKLTEEGVTHVELYDYLAKFINKMATGIIIDGKQKLGTGHSRLRSHLKAYLAHHQYNWQAMKARDERRKKIGCDLTKEARVLSQRDLNVLHYYQAQIIELQRLNQRQSVELNDYKKEVGAAEQKYQSLADHYEDLAVTQRETIKLLRQRAAETDKKIIQVEQERNSAKKELDELKRDQAKERLKTFAGRNAGHTDSQTNAPSFWSRWFS